MEKREAPWGLRPGEERGARVDAWRAERGMSRNAAVLLMIDMVLDLPENSKGERLVVRDLPGGGIEFLVHDEGLKAGIRAYGAKRGLSDEAAGLAVIEAALAAAEGPKNPKGAPTIAEVVEATAPAARAAERKMAKPGALEKALTAEAAVKAKSLPIKRASEMPDAPAREVDVSKLDVQVGPVRRAFGDLLKKGKK